MPEILYKTDFAEVAITRFWGSASLLASTSELGAATTLTVEFKGADRNEGSAI